MITIPGVRAQNHSQPEQMDFHRDGNMMLRILKIAVPNEMKNTLKQIERSVRLPENERI